MRLRENFFSIPLVQAGLRYGEDMVLSLIELTSTAVKRRDSRALAVLCGWPADKTRMFRNRNLRSRRSERDHPISRAMGISGGVTSPYSVESLFGSVDGHGFGEWPAGYPVLRSLGHEVYGPDCRPEESRRRLTRLSSGEFCCASWCLKQCQRSSAVTPDWRIVPASASTTRDRSHAISGRRGYL